MVIGIVLVIVIELVMSIAIISIAVSQRNGTLHLKDAWRVKKGLISGVKNGDNSGCSPPYIDRIGLWVYYNEIPIYPMFYVLKGD